MSQSPGGYSISLSLDFPWKKNDKVKAVEPKKKKKVLKPIINPIFESCSNLTDDDYWKLTFLDCARGKFPKNFIYKNGLLTHKKGNKIQRLEVPNSPIEAFNLSIEFFRNVGGLVSANDRARLQKIEEEKLLEMFNFSNTKWKDIKVEKVKEILISEFISDLCENHNFNEEEKKDLITTIKKGFMLEYFNKDNVIMEEGKIIEINGLIYNPEEKIYQIDPDYVVRKQFKGSDSLGIEKDEEETPVINFMNIWIKYLNSLDSKRLKKPKSYSSSFAVTNPTTDMSEDYSLSMSRSSFSKTFDASVTS